jgi:1-acyl-sn-glycerol-3-phosphate acyltransferase
MEEALQASVPVVLFPEGTSSNGQSVLRFRSGFFEPAVLTKALVTAATIGYASSTAEEAALAYHGEMPSRRIWCGRWDIASSKRE